MTFLIFWLIFWFHFSRVGGIATLVFEDLLVSLEFLVVKAVERRVLLHVADHGLDGLVDGDVGLECEVLGILEAAAEGVGDGEVDHSEGDLDLLHVLDLYEVCFVDLLLF